jgi:hypothetical protein
MNSSRPVAELLELRLDNATQAARWDELVGRSPNCDVYHRAAYVLASAELEHSQPVGLVISYDYQQYLLPILLRPISGPNGEAWLDASTPYGYGGVICVDCRNGNRVAVDLFHGLREWCANRGLVSCVLRSHPLLAQDWLLPKDHHLDFVTVSRRGQTASVPLEHWDDSRQCPPKLSKGRRSDLAYARRNLRVTWSVSSETGDALEQFRIFRDLYEKTMQRVEAPEFFHFPRSYYERLSALGPDVGVAIAWHGDSAVGGAIFMSGPMFGHYHLSAGDEAGQKYKASTLLVVEGAKWARKRGCRSLHLGGGILLNDSLMAFKRSFGGDQHQYGHITLIGDRERYNSMCSLAAPPWPYEQNRTSGTIRANAHSPLRVILMGKNKPMVRKGFHYLLDHGFCVVAVVL